MRSIKYRMETALWGIIDSLAWTKGDAIIRRKIQPGVSDKEFANNIVFILNQSKIRGYDNEPLVFRVVESGTNIKKNVDPKAKVAKVSHWWTTVAILYPCEKCGKYNKTTHQCEHCGWSIYKEL